MAPAPSLSVEQVRQLAIQGRIAKDPGYHAHERGYRFDELASRLAWVFKVAKDTRVNQDGELRHPDGYIAWCQDYNGRIDRIDFNLGRREDGEVLLLVTAMQVNG